MKKIFIGVFAALALAAFAAMPKSSAISGTTLPKSASVKTIPLSHTIKNVSGKIDVGFDFSLIPGADNPATVGGANMINTAQIITDVNPETREATASCTLNLSSLYFYKVGNYTFTIAERESTDELNFPRDVDNKYDIYFLVTNKLDENGKPTGELNVQLLDQMYSYKEDAKVSLNARFESSANYTYVALENEVRGAGADSDKYFKYKISFNGLAEGSELTINGQDAEVEYEGEKIRTVATQNISDGDIYVYLKHGQTVTVGDYVSGDVTARELPQNVSYTIEKIDSDDGYGITLDDSETNTVSKTVAAIGSESFEVNNVTRAANSKDATVNTGVFVASWPFLAAAAFGLGGFIIFRRLSRAS